MGNPIREHIAELLLSNKRHARYAAILACLALVVAMGVAGLLRRQGNAMTHEETVLDCQYSGTGAHMHDADCYDADGDLVCPLEERELHVHDDSCYEETSRLVCGLEESEGHTHDDSCYDEEGNLVCELEESEGHTHDDSCYETERELVCDEEEITEEHVHGPGCFTTVVVEDDEAEDEAEASDSMPAQTFEAHTNEKQPDDIYVYVEAPEGAFPADTTMKVKLVDKSDVEGAIDEAVAEHTDAKVVDIQTVDITFRNAEGEEIEPATEIMVQVTSNLIRDNEKPLIVHVDNDGRGEVIDTLDEEQLAERDLEKADDQLTFDAAEFSSYSIVITSIEQTLTAKDGHSYKVTVDCSESAGIPQGAELVVDEIAEGSEEYDTYLQQANEAIESEASFARFFDITIAYNGEPVQPAEPVDVKIKLADGADLSDNVRAVHFAEGGPEVLEASLDGKTVAFQADGFSVYAVVDEGDTGDNARMTINFWNGSEKIATMYVKNADDTDEVIAQIIYDPGVTIPSGYSFLGWTTNQDYTADSERVTIEDVRDSIKTITNANGIAEGNSMDYYAALYKVVDVTYLGDQGVSLGTDAFLRTPNDPETFSYTVNMSYTADATHNFEGWLVHEGGSHIAGHTEGKVYPNETEITIDGSVTFSVNAPEGQWLVFHENGQGATYIAPQFVKSGEKTQAPTIQMQRNGYTFGGWYTDEACTDGNEFTFGQQITDRTDIYAKWIPNTTANYTILIWKENLAGDGYDFAESVTLSGAVGTTINTVTQRGTGNDAYARVNNVDKKYTGFHLKQFDQNVTINTEGTAVLNVYYDRNEVTLNFYVYDYARPERYSIATSNDQNGIYYGAFDNSGYQGGQNPRRLYLLTDGSWGYPTDGTYSNWYGYKYVEGGQYYAPYNGTRYTRNGSWRLYTTTRGRFETLLSENNFTWPTAYNWYDTQGAGGGAGGTRTTFLDAYLPSNPNTTTVNMYGQEVNGDVPIRFYKQDPDNPDNYVLSNTVYGTAGSGFYISDKYHGFEAYQYSVDGGQRQSVGNRAANGYYNDGNTVIYNTGLNIYFNRLKYPILYMDGVYVDGSNNPVEGYSSRGQLGEVNDIVYGSNTSSYNKGGANYYEPTYDGFVFEGWYIDDACTHPYTFTTMPEGITVYAKWRQIQYRVFLHPNADGDTTLNWGSEDQEMNFRVGYMGSVSLPFGTRNGYEFVGWFADEACTIPYSSDTKLTDSNTVPYDKTVDMTNPMDKWGNIGANPYNSDATGYQGGDRFWINRKLDLYGRWRKVIDGAEGIGIVYDLNGGSSSVQDNRLYKDSTQAVAQNAPTAPANKVFDHWVVQTYNSKTGKYEDTNAIVYPGGNFTVDKDLTKVEVTEWKSSKATNARKQVQNPAEVYSGTDTITGPSDFPFISSASYTIQLKAVYIDKGERTPTYIDWFKNDQNPSQMLHEDKDLHINEAVDIQHAPTRNGYEFLGWARESEYTMVDGQATGNKITYVGDKDLFLKYDKDTDKYQAKDATGAWVDVTQVAADENMPYHALYAQWKKKTYTVTVTKVTEEAFENEPFAFTSTFNPALDQSVKTSFSLVGNTEGATVEGVTYANTKQFVEVPYGTKFSITEDAPYYSTAITYTCAGADDTTKNVTNQSVGANQSSGELTVDGNMTVVFTNTHKMGYLKIGKHFDVQEFYLDGVDMETRWNDLTFWITNENGDYIKIKKETEGSNAGNFIYDGVVTAAEVDADPSKKPVIHLRDFKRESSNNTNEHQYFAYAWLPFGTYVVTENDEQAEHLITGYKRVDGSTGYHSDEANVNTGTYGDITSGAGEARIDNIYRGSENYTNIKVKKTISGNVAVGSDKKFYFVVKNATLGMYVAQTNDKTFTTDIAKAKVFEIAKDQEIDIQVVGNVTYEVIELDATTNPQAPTSPLIDGCTWTKTVSPTSVTPEKETPIDTVDVITIDNNYLRPSTDVYLNKVETGKTAPLPGSQFKLYRKNAAGEYAVDESINWTKATKTLDLADGRLPLTGLPEGDYRLTETKAPDGYIILNKDVYFTVQVSDDENASVVVPTTGQESFVNVGASVKQTVKKDDTLVVANTPGTELPMTGGPGTHLFTIIGTAMIVGALMYGSVLRRRSERRSIG